MVRLKREFRWSVACVVAIIGLKLFFRTSPPPPLALPPPSVPVPIVFVFFSDGDVPPYQRAALDAARALGTHDVFLLHPSSPEFESPLLQRFRDVYQPWGLREPWERQNFERFFLLERFAHVHGFAQVSYFDSDVLVFNVGDMPPDCDAAISWESAEGDDYNAAATLNWVAWAGSSILKIDVLRDFLEFTVAVYADHLPLLKLKRDHKPFVCDMSLWYLFAGQSDLRLRTKWRWDELPILKTLPWTPPRRFCDATEEPLRFDHKHAHLRTANTNTIHFQGSEKEKLVVRARK